VCDATLGPGATNLVTALVESLNAGIPLIAITGDSNREHSWKNLTQESRQVEILRPAVKDLIRVESSRRIPELIRRAFAIATSGRPGPVLLDFPEDVSHDEVEFKQGDFWVDSTTLRVPSRRCRPDAVDVERAANHIKKAKRPILLVGGGIHISEAYEPLRLLAEEQGIPVAHTMSGKGAIACTHKLSAGLFGRYSRIANDLIAQADVLIVVGCKLGEIATKRFQLIQPQHKVIHIDICAEEISRTCRTEVGLVGDAKLALLDLSAALGRNRAASLTRDDCVAELGSRLAVWRSEATGKLESTEKPINVGRLMNELNIRMPADGILITDGGFAAHWGALLYDTKQSGRNFVADRGFASIGYGLPGSMGAQLAVGPARRVVGITGDGGFNMTLGELETARRANANFVLCVVNNAASGYVKALQHSFYGVGKYQSSDLSEMNYAVLARDMGCKGIRVEDPGSLGTAIEEGLENTSCPTVIDIVVTRDPSKMLPGIDNRALQVKKGDRPV
jgi:acetolactate synthase-1/2/3 large subunit